MRGRTKNEFRKFCEEHSVELGTEDIGVDEARDAIEALALQSNGFQSWLSEQETSETDAKISDASSNTPVDALGITSEEKQSEVWIGLDKEGNNEKQSIGGSIYEDSRER